MNRSNVVGAVVGAITVLSIGAIGGYQVAKGPSYAKVTLITPVHQSVRDPEKVCETVPVTHRAPVKDENRIAGSVIGGVAGGLLGNQFGRGTGNTLSTIAGAAGGAYAGNKVQQNLQERDTYTSSEKKCHVVQKYHDAIVGYDVRYSLNGQESTVRMSEPPADNRIPVEHGKLVLSQATQPPKSDSP